MCYNTCMKRIVHLMLGLALVASVAFVAWFARDLEARRWKSDQHLHVRWNATWFSDQYNRIDKLGNEDLRRDYVTNFCHNACILLNLNCKTSPSTSNIVERYYFDWEDRIDRAERAASAPEIQSSE